MGAKKLGRSTVRLQVQVWNDPEELQLPAVLEPVFDEPPRGTLPKGMAERGITESMSRG